MVKLITETKEYKEIGEIISKGLKRRESDKSLHEPSEEDKIFPKYVMVMIKEISEYMPVSCVEQVKRHDQYAMGHVDYHSKLTLYCARLYNELKDEKENETH